jgi:hypothetical protein
MDRITNTLILSIGETQWRKELEKSSTKYHITVCWIAIIFDPIFGINDYFNIPNAWQQILVIRFSVSLIALALLLLRKRFRIPSYLIVFVPFLLISLQNAYTFSFINTENFSGHVLNYAALFIGAGMFLLWEWYYSTFMVVVSIIATAFLSISVLRLRLLGYL